MSDFINSSLLNNSATLASNSTLANIQTRDNILFIVQVLTLICLIVYVIKTWEIASATREAARSSEKTLQEMKQAREQEYAPYILVYCEVPIPYDTMIYLIVKNIGKSIAVDVKISFTPRLSSSVTYTNDFDINNITFLKEGIKSIPPGYVIRTTLGRAVEYFSHSDFPLKYEVEISYVDSINKIKINSSQTIDLFAIKQLNYTEKFDLNDLVTEVKSLTTEIKNLHEDKKT
jgi:hypothetical protein